jgi:hypothetical protein
MTRILYHNGIRLLKKCCLLGVLFVCSILIGCSDMITTDDNGTIYIYNYDDDHEYRVELHLVADDSLIATCFLDEYPDDGYEASFEELEEEYYYISIFRDGVSDETGRSGTFHLEEDEALCFRIEDDGDIKNCS